MSKKYRSLIRFIHKGVEVSGNVVFDENNVPFNALDFDLLIKNSRIIPLDDEPIEKPVSNEILVEKVESLIEKVTDEEFKIDEEVNETDKQDTPKRKGRKPNSN